MTQPTQATVRNRLLGAMSAQDFALLQPHLHRMPVRLRQSMLEANTPVDALYFPETGFTSVTSTNQGGRIEIGLIGPEGLVGATPVLLGSDRTPHDHFVQAEGDVLRIEAEALIRASDDSVSLRRLLLRYLHVFLVQTAQTAFVNANHDVETRLVRWLLMCQDRLASPDFAVTHEFLAMMLGVQRTSVTLALHLLEGRGWIRAKRGRIEMRDRAAMVDGAGDAYGIPEAEYARLIGAGPVPR